MSQQLINLSPDLTKLRDEGYEVSIEHGHLVLRGVPYVDVMRRVRRGTLVSTLSASGNRTNPPDTHVVMFGGTLPCDHNGCPLEKIHLGSSRQHIGGDLVVDHTFSSKPAEGYADYHAKMTTYAAIISNPAAALDDTATPRTFRIIEAADDSPFVYFDNASGRAGIAHVTQKFRGQSVAIVGLGGTGSYILDLVAKTPVRSVHLFDGDVFEQHNAFRAPGAASLDALRLRLPKVEYFAKIYAGMHQGIVPHSNAITPENVEDLRRMDMVFLCIDNSQSRAAIISSLEAFAIPFIDVGIGVEMVDGGLIGSVRTTTSTTGYRDHVVSRSRVPLTEVGVEDMYARNIQVADLNALNACLAVIRWKKLLGFYRDTEREHFSLFTVDANHILNEDAA